MSDYSYHPHPGHVPLHEMPYLMRLALVLYRLYLVSWHFDHISEVFKEAKRDRWMSHLCCSGVDYYGHQVFGCYAILTCEYYSLLVDGCP